MTTEPDQTRSPVPTTRLQASGRLSVLANDLEDGDVSLGSVVDRMGHAGFGLLLLLLTIIVLIPIPGPVGMLLGTVIVFVAVQLLAGARRLWLPDFIRRLRIPGPMLRAMVEKTTPWLERIEAFTRPRRWMPLTGRGARMMLAAPLVVLGGVIALPIPLGNFMPALALIVISLGLVARDGVAIAIGLVLTIVAVVWTGVLFVAGSEIVKFLFGWLA